MSRTSVRLVTEAFQGSARVRYLVAGGNHGPTNSRFLPMRAQAISARRIINIWSLSPNLTSSFPLSPPPHRSAVNSPLRVGTLNLENKVNQRAGYMQVTLTDSLPLQVSLIGLIVDKRLLESSLHSVSSLPPPPTVNSTRLLR